MRQSPRLGGGSVFSPYGVLSPSADHQPRTAAASGTPLPGRRPEAMERTPPPGAPPGGRPPVARPRPGTRSRHSRTRPKPPTARGRRLRNRPRSSRPAPKPHPTDHRPTSKPHRPANHRPRTGPRRHLAGEPPAGRRAQGDDRSTASHAPAWTGPPERTGWTAPSPCSSYGPGTQGDPYGLGHFRICEEFAGDRRLLTSSARPLAVPRPRQTVRQADSARPGSSF